MTSSLSLSLFILFLFLFLDFATSSVHDYVGEVFEYKGNAFVLHGGSEGIYGSSVGGPNANTSAADGNDDPFIRWLTGICVLAYILTYPKAQGDLVNITIVGSAVDKGADRGRMVSKSGKCDPYVKLQYGKASHRTKTILHTSNPVWNQMFELEEIGGGEYLKIKCYTAETFGDENIGSAQVSLEGIQEGTRRDMWIPLERVSSGELRLKIEDVQSDYHEGYMVQSNYRVSDPAFATKTPTPKQKDPAIRPPQNSVLCNEVDSIEKDSKAAAYKIAEAEADAEAKAFLASEAAKEVENVLKMFEDTDSLRMFAEEVVERCKSRGMPLLAKTIV